MNPTYSRVYYTSTGTAQDFSVPFPFIDKTHIHIFAIDPNDRRLTIEYPIAEWINTSTPKVRPSGVLAQGQQLAVVRVTPRDAPLVDFSDGSIIEATDLDLGVIQNLYICEEILDELGWQSNEIDLLWTAYNNLNTSHQALSEAVSALRIKLEETYTIAVRGFNIAQDCCTWIRLWQDEFLPAISMFINITVVDGGTAGTIDEIYCIVDGNIDPDEYADATVYDGGTSADYHFAWTPEALKLINAYDLSEKALATAKKAMPIAQRAYDMAALVYNSDPFIIDGGGVDEMMEFIE